MNAEYTCVLRLPRGMFAEYQLFYDEEEKKWKKKF